ncbi:MAG: AraC family transcriptional regulator, partial [Deltaproteobacteria bacterium]
MELVSVDEVAARGFGLAERLPPHQGEWHAHARHQLLYAAAGSLELEAGDVTWALPPVRAAWIAAGVRHRTRAGRPVELRTLYLDPALPVPAPTLDLGVFAVDDLARAMILHAMRWGPDRDPRDEVADRFFGVLLDGARAWTSRLAAFRLPRPSSDALARAA